MDRIAALLDGPRASGAFVLRSLLDPPWSMRICDEAPLTIVAIIRGDAWITQHDTSVHLVAGSTAIVQGPAHYTVASAPATAPDIIIHPGQRCETVNGEPLVMSMRLGVRTWGTSIDAATAMLTGTYHSPTTLGAELLEMLPAMIVTHNDSRDSIVALLADETVRDVPGQQIVLDRLLDVLVVDTIRSWYQQQLRDEPNWWHAHHDPIVGDAMRLIHDSPEQPWTIVALAREVGTSRANLARRFTDLVGEPPITYLTRWRLSLAAHLMIQPNATVTSTARSVGYSSPFALSTAFKRRYGISPHQHRSLTSAALNASQP